ncbi:hypothetical protein BDW02DRAFT_573261 [Decorospora gaudefroyi]|uniref:Uncharacterized protein n=1 Tax=Decorospora gaudefroyi TaxID=184978 RepID=A0A6A5K6T8_9PLEO|nr:hypothetical protein BDW02DRAFT_573261 [Decorospora gaudefroyi]
MFKPTVLRRNFSLFRAIPHARIVRSAVRHGHEAVTIHRVRIRRPFFRKSRLVGAIALGTAAYGLGKLLDITVEVDEIEEDKRPMRSDSRAQEDGWQDAGKEGDDDEEEEEDEEDDDDDDDDDAILFLPTGFSRPRPATFYKGSDPEWQEFRKISRDRERVHKIRGELVAMLRNFAANSPKYVARVGKVDTEKGKAWLEIKFPDGPPIEYERPGIELTEDLEWRKATRPVEAVHHHHLNRILYPTEAANALYTDTTKKARKSWKDFKVYMGWEEAPKTEIWKQFVKRIDTQLQSSRSASASSTTTTPDVDPNPNPNPNPLAKSSAKDTQQSAASSSAPPAGDVSKDMRLILPDPKKMTLDLSQFREDFKKAFRPYPKPLPRGAFLVMGLIEIHGTKARMTINVGAAYDPKQGCFINLQGSVYHYAEHRQSPRGGP